MLLAILIILSTRANASLFYASGALKVGYGTNSTTDKSTVPSTKMAAYSAEGSAGLRLKIFLLGVSGEYSFHQQLSDPTKISNINTEGTLTAFSPMIGLDVGTIRVIGKLPSIFSGDYTLSKKNASAGKVSYSYADSIAIQLQWTPSRNFLLLPYLHKTDSSKSNTFWGIEYQSLKFKKVKQGESELTLSDAQKLEIKTYSLIYGIFI
ncbi:MAG: hypothetical protein K2Q18_08700 [Bdellovibrionales bacterium]|nr:hypothetical protein [Bdellovibrionales bacterium]